MNLFDDFYPKVTAMHKELSESKSTAADEDTSSASSQQSSQYDLNWHQPLLFVLQKTTAIQGGGTRRSGTAACQTQGRGMKIISKVIKW